MIIELLLTGLFNIFSLLTSPIDIPSIPETVFNGITDFTEFIVSGVSVLGNYIDLQIASILFSIVLSIDIGLALYHFVMWVIKKIPFFGIS